MKANTGRVAVLLFSLNLITPAIAGETSNREDHFDVFLAEVNSSRTTAVDAAGSSLLFIGDGPLASDIPLNFITLPREIPSLALTLPDDVIAKINRSLQKHAPLKLVLMHNGQRIFAPVVQAPLTSNELLLTFSSRSEYSQVRKLLEG